MYDLSFDFSRMKDRLVFLIHIDGLAYEVFRELMEEARLPNLARLAEDLPSTYGRVITTFPSATAPSLPEMLTGRWSRNFFRHPRKINAFDRVQKKAFKYEFIPEAWSGELVDLFDIIRQSGHRILSFFSGQFNAATATYHDTVSYGVDALSMFGGKEISGYDRKTMDKLLEMLKSARPCPMLVFLGLTGVDLAGHSRGPNSDVYKTQLIETDRLLGSLIKFLRRTKDERGKRLFDKSLFLVFGDHGMVSSSRFIDLPAVFKAEGFKVSDLGTLGHMVSEKLNPFWMFDREILSVPGGSNISELYVRRKFQGRVLDWDEFCSYSQLRDYPIESRFQDTRNVDIIGLLLEQEGVGEVLAAVYDNAVKVHTRDRGSATIYRRPGLGNDTFAYQAHESSNGADPFGYLNDPEAEDMVCADRNMTVENWVEERFDRHFHPLRKWVRATLNTDYPAAAPLIPKAFTKHNTTSDIIVNATPPYNFSKYFQGDHGTLIRESVTSGMLIAGPGVRAGADISDFMLVDVLPTMLKLLGVSMPPTFEKFLDGVAHPELAEEAPRVKAQPGG